MTILRVILLLVGSSAIIYYLVILSILGFRKDFSLCWLGGAVGCFSLFALLAQLEKTQGKGIGRLVTAIYICLGVAVLFFTITETIIIRTGYSKPHKDADYLIVLGAQVKGTKVSQALKNRLEAAYSYAMENDSTKIIVSGGQGNGEDITEAQAMYDYLVGRGIAPDRILKEEQSTNTNENIMYSKEMMDDAEYVVIVTNRFHLYRGTRIAKKQLTQKVEGLGAKTGNILFLNYFVREAFAVVKDKVVHNI
ncbi:MAG: YdcF family protein [Clostridium sp.]|nr:YdcF family protein [Clostridium sp.]